MNRLGIQSLNAGAPDLRLTGDQTQRGSYVQRRRAQMAGGGIMGSNAGSMLVAPTADGSRPGYGILDKVGDFLGSAKDKIVDDLIPNELKENPMAAAALLGGAANYMDIIPGQMSSEGWIGDLLGGAGDMISTGVTKAKDFLTPGTFPDYSGVTGVYPPGMMGGTQMSDFPFLSETGFQLPSPNADKNIIQQFGGWVKDQATGAIRNVLTGQTSTGAGGGGGGTGQGLNIAIPMGIGAAAGAYQKKYLEDQPPFPGDETGIKFQTAQEAMADPNLRFKPEAQYANVAEGGRIGYDNGGDVKTVSMEAGQESTLEEIYQDFIAQGFSPREAAKKAKQAYDDMQIDMAQGGRIGYKYGTSGLKNIIKRILELREKQRLSAEEQELRTTGIGAAEGGLMNLGGMEKDYRQEGGFVPIGGKEKADDVPARLSKNEFVFTADAVRNAGGGDIDQGAEVMENLMEHLEAGGEVSEDSQGLEGARGMFANAQQLEKRII